MRGQFATLFLASVCVGVNLAYRCEFQIKNSLTEPIWIGIAGDVGHSTPSNGGFTMSVKQEISIYVANDWSGKLWARTWCNDDPNSKNCQTGDCGNKVECAGSAGTPPVTLVNFMLKSGVDKIDAYEISLVQGFNVNVLIAPIDGVGDCKTLVCRYDLNDKCPEQLRTILYGSRNTIIACHSSCTKFNTDQYCCTGAFNSSHSCKTRNWVVNSAHYFKENCPTARSYEFDKQRRSYTCWASKYKIVFFESKTERG